MPIDPLTTAALGKVVDVADKVGLLQKLFAKVIGNPDLAVQQLAVVVGEVRRTLGSLRDTILEIGYLGVPGQESIDVQRALNRIESDELLLDVIRSKGSCMKIGHIYDNHLNAWFPSFLGNDEQKKLEELFKDLSDSDGWANEAAEKLLLDAKPFATEVRQLLDKGDEAGARKRVGEFMTALRPTLEKLSMPIAAMLDLERQFIEKQRLV